MRPGPLRDVLLVARFELLRARRTWSALAVIVLFAIAAGGSAYLFTQILLEIENNIATTLGVPTVDRPGALTEAVLHGEDLQRMLRGLVGRDPELLQRVLYWPLVAVFHFWTSLVLVPFLAAFTSADAIADDVRTRAVRFELLRTGRLELVLGRFLGQVLMVALAIGLAGLVAFAVAWWCMVMTDPLWVLTGLLVMSGRSLVFALPFIGLGVGCSMVVRSAIWARVLALVGTTASFVLYGVVRAAEHEGYALVVSPLAVLLPAAWVRPLWFGGTDGLFAALYLAALAVTLVGIGSVILSRRDA